MWHCISGSAVTFGSFKPLKASLSFILLKYLGCRLSGLRLCSAVWFHLCFFPSSFLSVVCVLIAALQRRSCTDSAAVCSLQDESTTGPNTSHTFTLLFNILRCARSQDNWHKYRICRCIIFFFYMCSFDFTASPNLSHVMQPRVECWNKRLQKRVHLWGR